MGILPTVHPPFPPPWVGLTPSLVGTWSEAGIGGDSLHSRTRFGGASCSLTHLRTRAPLLRAQVWLFCCPFLRSPKIPLAGRLARLRAPSISVVVGDFSGPHCLGSFRVAAT